jgi:DNA-binding response OmpR family regulator
LISGFLSEQRRISGLEGGADDYISKPYGGGELVARVKAVLRRYQQGGTEQDQESDEELVLEGNLFVAQYRSKQLTLTPREWKLLRRLTTLSGKVVPREELSTLLWGDDGLLHECELDRCVEQLNRKLKDEGAPEEVRPVPGGGLRIVSPAPSLTQP